MTKGSTNLTFYPLTLMIILKLIIHLA